MLNLHDGAVFHSAGGKHACTNLDLLTSYGFIEPDSPSDLVSLISEDKVRAAAVGSFGWDFH